MSNGGNAALAWAKVGENNWVATAPSGATTVYDGPRFALVDPGPSATINQRFTLNIDLSFVHRLTLSRAGRAQGFLSRETAADRLAKRLRFSTEFQSGDQDFDDRVYVALGRADAAEALVVQSEARRLILELFDLGVSRIEAGREQVTLHLGYAPSPAMDGGQALSAITVRVDALTDLWPAEASAYLPYLPLRLPWRIDGASLALAWAGCWGVAILAAGWFGDVHDARQIETFAGPDWLGLGVLLATIVVPSALLAARRADAHRVLGLVLAGAVVAMPFSQRLRIVEINRLAARDERTGPARIVELAPEEPGVTPSALVSLGNSLIEWPLSELEAEYARQGRLCVQARTVEGLRGLRYVESLRIWPCSGTAPEG